MNLHEEEDGRAEAVPPTRSGFCLVALEPLQLLERKSGFDAI